MIRRPPRSPLFPSTPLFRSRQPAQAGRGGFEILHRLAVRQAEHDRADIVHVVRVFRPAAPPIERRRARVVADIGETDRKSTRLNSSHSQISYAVFCLKKKKK